MIYIEDEYSYNGTVQIVTLPYRFYTNKDGKYVENPTSSGVSSGEFIEQELAFGYDSINQDYVALGADACLEIRKLAKGGEGIFKKLFKIKKVYGELIVSLLDATSETEQRIDDAQFKKFAKQYLNVSELEMKRIGAFKEEPKKPKLNGFAAGNFTVSTSSATTSQYITFTIT